MKYINGHDLPEHIRSVLKRIVVSNETAHVTTPYGSAVIISLKEYDNLKALRQDQPYKWMCGCRPGRELDGALRDEVDF